MHTDGQQFYSELYIQDKEKYNNIHNSFIHNSAKLKKENP